MIREEPYPGLNCRGMWEIPQPFGASAEVFAWLSSARAVRCRLRCHNERNPSRSCHRVMPGTLRALPPQGVRKAGMTSNQHGPYVRGYTCYNGAHRGRAAQASDRETAPQFGLGSATRPTKLDSLVIAHQPWRGEYVPGPCHTARQAMKPGRLKSVTARVGLGRNR